MNQKQINDLRLTIWNAQPEPSDPTAIESHRGEWVDAIMRSDEGS
jgi:hypothetical protein